MKPQITLVVNKTNNMHSLNSGISTYVSLLRSSIQEVYDVHITHPLYLFHYPVYLKQPKGIMHLASQDLALPLFFKEYSNTVITVHDIIPLQYPLFENAPHIQWKTLDKGVYVKTIKALQNATHIICVSHATRNALVSYVPALAEKTTVIHEYPKKIFQFSSKKRNLYDVLYVGSEMPYKNLQILLEAFALVNKEFPKARLIKIGNSHWSGAKQQLMQQSAALGIHDSIVWKDTVENLQEEYNSAAVYVQPSLYEGFGLPVVEAMACGCPVVASNIEIFHEIGGNALQYFDPTSSKELAKTIIILLRNKKTQQEMQKKGLLQVKKFNKQTFQKKTIEVYENLLSTLRRKKP